MSIFLKDNCAKHNNHSISLNLHRLKTEHY